MKKPKAITSVDDLTPDLRNANKHSPRGMGMMETSIRECGFGDSMTVDREGRVISGNARAETLADMKMLDAIVVQSDGTRPIVHQRIDLDLATDDRAKRLALLQNRVGQVNLEWDAEVLAAMAADGVKLDDLFAGDELDALLGNMQPVIAPEDFKEVDENVETAYCCPKCGYKWSGKPE